MVESHHHFGLKVNHRRFRAPAQGIAKMAKVSQSGGDPPYGCVAHLAILLRNLLWLSRRMFNNEQRLILLDDSIGHLQGRAVGAPLETMNGEVEPSVGEDDLLTLIVNIEVSSWS